MLLVLYGNLSIELTRTREPPTPGHVRPHLGPPEARVRSPPGDREAPPGAGSARREAPGAPEGGGSWGYNLTHINRCGSFWEPDPRVEYPTPRRHTLRRRQSRGYLPCVAPRERRDTRLGAL